MCELFVNYFEEKVKNVLKRLLRRRCIQLNDISIEDRPILSLLLNRLYYEIEKMNRQHRRVISCTRASKYNTRIVAFVNNKLIYNNVEYYLSYDIKNKIISQDIPDFMEVIEQLEFS